MNHPPGLALQQDLAIAGLLGLTHAEKNGHHYIGARTASPQAIAALRAHHPALYVLEQDSFRLAIKGGHAAIDSLACEGFASGAAVPDGDRVDPIMSASRAA